MTIALSIIFVALALFLIWRVFQVASRYRPIEDPPREMNVREPVPRRPKGRAGAVAIEEPEDDTDTDAYSRRRIP